MRLSSSLYIRKLLASIHPPISPQSPRESKQLLNLLESALQRRLDETHPSPKNLAAGHDTPNGSESIPDPAHRVTRSTHSHLEAVLGHPLFQQQSLTFLQTTGLTSAAVKTFDRALLNNKLDSDLVQSCVLQYLQGREKRGRLSKDEALAPRLARWFNAMTGPEKKELLLNEKYLEPIVSVMYADGCEEEVWQWLQVLYERSFNNKNFFPVNDSDAMAFLRAEDRLVSLMIKGTARQCRLQEAAQLYTQACEYRLRSTAPLPEPLLRSWRQIAGAILQYPKYRKTIPTGLYDLLLKHGLNIEYSPFDPAVLQIYHPSSPSATLLNQKLKDASFVAKFEKWHKNINQKFLRRILLVSILDAAELSMSQADPGQAKDLLDFAERAYPDFLRPHQHDEAVETADRLRLARKEILLRKEFRPSGYAVALDLQLLA